MLQARHLQEAAARQERVRLLEASIALRAAQADKAGWEKWMREMRGD